jgi:hypothetical protein
MAQGFFQSRFDKYAVQRSSGGVQRSGGFSIFISGLAEAPAELQAAIMSAIPVGLEKIGLRGVPLVQDHTPVGATGNLFGGVFAEFHQAGPVMEEIIADHPPADVYVGPVELGTRPHFPPFDGSLLLWVKNKHPELDEKHARSLAFLIARAISRRGTKGQHMFDQALAQLKIEAPGIMEAAIASSLEAAGFGGTV